MMLVYHQTFVLIPAINIHDSKIALDTLPSEAINIKNKKFLADCGYDSNEFKNLLLSNNNAITIPKK